MHTEEDAKFIDTKNFDSEKLLNEPVFDNTFKEEVKRIAEIIVSLSSFGQSLHVNDILPDIEKLCVRARNEGIEEGKREILEIKLKDWKTPRS